MMPPPPPFTRVGAVRFGIVLSKNSKYLKNYGAPRRPVIVLSKSRIVNATRRMTPL